MGAEKKPADGGRDKKDYGKSSGSTVSVFKVDMYCDGCAKEFTRAVKHMDGVEDVKVDIPGNKLTVTGKVDAAEIKAKLKQIKPKRKVEIVKKVRFADQPKKDDGGGEEKKVEEKKHKLKKAEPEEKRVEEKKHKLKKAEHEPPKEKTKKKVDKAKELVAVTRTMDVDELIWRYFQDKPRGSKDVAPTNKQYKAINIYISGDVNFNFGK